MIGVSILLWSHFPEVEIRSRNCGEVQSVSPCFSSRSHNKLNISSRVPNTHILHGVRVLLLIEVVVKRGHVRLFEIGLERNKTAVGNRKDKSELWPHGGNSPI